MKLKEFVRILDSDELVMVSDVSNRNGITVACEACKLPIKIMGDLEVVFETRKEGYLKVEVM